MKNFVVALIIIIISVVSSKPIEEYTGSISKRQLPDVTTLNKQFFDSIFQATRITRDTDDVNAVPTIALHDLISSVEHTLIHSAQNLAASNVTINNSTTTASETDSSNVSHIQHIVLPITIPTPAPQTNELMTEVVDTTTVTEDENEDDDSIRDNRSSEKIDSEHKEVDFESVKPIENSNLGLLFPIALSPVANISHVENIEDDDKEVPVTEETKVDDQKNITILQTINSTQTIPTQSDVVHVHQQQITLFSANAGVFPNIHAVNAEDLPVLAQAVQTSSAKPDCSGEETSNESSGDDATSSSEEQSSSSSSSEEKEKVKKTSCSHKSSVATSKTVENSTPSDEAVKKLKTDELKEKIAEVEAEPVILTQGI